MKRCVLLAAWVLLAAGCDGRTAITFGTAPGGPAQALTHSVADNLAPSFAASTVPFNDTAALINAVRNRQVDFAMIEQPHTPVDDLAMVVPMYPSVLHILVRKDLHNCRQPISFADLLTMGTVYAGAPGSTGYDLLADLSNSQWLPPLTSIDMLPTAFGEPPDIHVEFGGILHPDAARRLQDYCLASLGDVSQLGRGAWAEGLSYRYPHLQPFILPAGLYPNLNPQPVLTLAVTSMLITHPATDTDLVYDVTERVYELSSQLNEIYPLAGETIHADHVHELYTLPQHAGALRYEERNAPTFLERYAEILAFSVTLLVALTSAGVAIIRLRRQAKKDRIDAYFSKLLAFREASQDGATDPQTEQQIRNLQSQVTELVVAERIQADAAYLAFLSLSDQVIRELNP